MSQMSLEQGEEQLVVFRLANEFYALGIDMVQEIVTWKLVTRVPGTPPFLEGIINLRGKVIPVIDLRKRFALGQAEVGQATRIVVVEIGQQVVGLVVDEVSEVLRVPRDRIHPPEEVVIGVHTAVLRGVAKVDDRLIIVMDPTQILAYSEQ